MPGIGDTQFVALRKLIDELQYVLPHILLSWVVHLLFGVVADICLQITHTKSRLLRDLNEWI